MFVESDGRAKLRPVEAGHSDGLQTEVLAGLAAGARVVRHPTGSSRMAPGCGVADDGDRDCKAPGSVPP